MMTTSTSLKHLLSLSLLILTPCLSINEVFASKSDESITAKVRNIDEQDKTTVIKIDKPLFISKGAPASCRTIQVPSKTNYFKIGMVIEFKHVKVHADFPSLCKASMTVPQYISTNGIIENVSRLPHDPYHLKIQLKKSHYSWSQPALEEKHLCDTYQIDTPLSKGDAFFSNWVGKKFNVVRYYQEFGNKNCIVQKYDYYFSL